MVTELVKMVTPCLTPQKGLRGEEGRGELGRVDRAVGQLTAHLQGCLRQLIDPTSWVARLKKKVREKKAWWKIT